jgi:phenylalanyl-tRNA synthetase alpha chain
MTVADLLTVPVISEAQLQQDLLLRDLSDYRAGSHAMQSIVDMACAAAVATVDLPVHVVRSSRVVSVADNYDALRIGPEAATRAQRYSRYVTETTMLRSHTSAAIPPALRQIVTPRWLAVPGLVYRRDQVDARHSAAPHQMDLWCVTPEALDAKDLLRLVGNLMAVLLPGCEWRTTSVVHPYTVGGLQVDVLVRGEWLEVAECGLAHPEVLSAAGLTGWSGLALGMGLDRMLMVVKGVPDIRLLRSNDQRIAGQMNDLLPYIAVSTMPQIVRDISVSVADGDDIETIGGMISDALGADAHLLESVDLVTETPASDMLPVAAARLGMLPGHKNMLLRVVVRAVDRTLTKAEANVLRNRVMKAVHAGSVEQPDA